MRPIASLCFVCVFGGVIAAGCSPAPTGDSGQIDDVLTGSDVAGTSQDSEMDGESDDASGPDIAKPDAPDAAGPDAMAVDTDATDVAPDPDATADAALDAGSDVTTDTGGDDSSDAAGDDADTATNDTADAADVADAADASPDIALCNPLDATPCDDANQCTDDLCDAGTCQHTANSNPCILADACSVGGCVSGACEVAHPLVCDDDNPCTTDSCDPGVGCTTQPASGEACDDGDGCTSGDACLAGLCTPGAQMGCDDGNVCSDDACVDGGCVNTPNTATCTDNDACTAGDTCGGGSCAAGGAVECNDDITCTVESCVWSAGCVGGPEDSLCDDGNLCSNDTCDTEVGCVNELLNFVPCDDGDACSAGDICLTGTCTPNGTTDCDDNDACTDNNCDSLLGCSFPSAVTPCDDNNPCTADYCDSAKGCAVQAAYDASPCTDDNAETTLDLCKSGKCVGLDVATIPAGTFFMGCAPNDPNCYNEEKPGHLVTLNAFYLDRKEVTVAQMKACYDAGECPFFSGAPGCSGEDAAANADKTMTCAYWNDAVAYCTWTGGRLPTEAEWEKAARGGCELYPDGQCEAQASVYPWGDAAMTCALANAWDVGNAADCVGFVTAPGLLPTGKSPYGVLDMAGNAAEWVADWYDASYYTFTPFDGWMNPKGPSVATDARAMRGGAYSWPAVLQRNSARSSSSGSTKYAGFRCAHDVQ